MSVVHDAAHHGLLGTVILIRVTAASAELAETAERVMVHEIDRLQRVFSIYDPSSELNRWRRGELDDPGGELTAVLAAASSWFEASQGTFHPASRVLTDRWRAAEAAGAEPNGRSWLP
ncbi:MAG: FAD:protein FMN transferase [Ilumatobacteraceae bacterium]